MKQRLHPDIMKHLPAKLKDIYIRGWVARWDAHEIEQLCEQIRQDTLKEVGIDKPTKYV